MTRLPLLALAWSGAAFAFSYDAAGDLVPGSGTGQSNSPVHVVDMRFPMETAPAYANSQVYAPGGSQGGGGSQCDASNYSYPWHDNYCESRSWPMPLCPSGTGHQGQDIRPASCQDNTHWVVATESGTITNIGTYSVYLQGVSGVRHRFLHMQMSALQVSEGQYVTRGQRLGRVSNDFGGTPTTIHLHYDMYKNVSGVGSVYVSPYNSLVTSYQGLLGLTPTEDPSVCVPTPIPSAANERFVDVAPGSTGEEHIYALLDAGITTGCAPDLFCPDCPTERYMMAVFIARAAGLDLSSPPSTPSFTDVPTSAWYYPHVEAVRSAGIVSGCNATEFCPTNPLLRKEAAKMLVLAAGMPTRNPGTPSFTDVPRTDWSYTFVESLKEYCVTTGCTATEFCPADVTTRRMAAIFLARAFDLDDLNTCIRYCDTSTCDGGSFCEDWGSCGSFSNTCDETGTQTRVCHDFACSGSFPTETCVDNARTESRNCSRDTDGTVVANWGNWGTCDVPDPACGGPGTEERTRTVCANGSTSTQTDARNCTAPVTVDADNDGVCDADDLCLGDDATGDTDNDGVCGDRDLCPGDDALDGDGDGVPDACDLCLGDDATGDADLDGICSDNDLCVGDDALDFDLDGVPDACDLCLGYDDFGDADLDGLCEPVLTASDVIPGEVFEITLEGAPPGATVFFGASFRGPGTTCVTPNICISLDRPFLLGSAEVEENGILTLPYDVPPAAPPGVPIRFQAVWMLGNQGEASNVIVRTSQLP
jgi:hypothetical protein